MHSLICTKASYEHSCIYVQVRQSAQAVKQYVPQFYHLAKWAYNHDSNLLVRSDGSGPTVIKSSSGVRQGDPLGPLFYDWPKGTTGGFLIGAGDDQRDLVSKLVRAHVTARPPAPPIMRPA